MFSEVAEIALVARLGQFQQLLNTQMILILNFTRPHTITYTNCHFAGHFAVGNGNATTEVTVLIGTTAVVLQIIQVKKNCIDIGYILQRYCVRILNLRFMMIKGIKLEAVDSCSLRDNFSKTRVGFHHQSPRKTATAFFTGAWTV